MAHFCGPRPSPPKFFGPRQKIYAHHWVIVSKMAFMHHTVVATFNICGCQRL